MEQLLAVLTQIAVFLILIALGILIVKIRILDAASLEKISGLIIKVSLPSYIFINAVSGTTREDLKNSLIIFPVALVLYIVMALLSMLMEKICRLKGNRQKIFRACLMFGNIGFMGIPLVSTLYPNTAVLYVSIFTIVDQLAFWTYGLGLTKPVREEKEKFSFKNLKNLISPPLVAIILALIFILIGVKVPAVFTTVLTALGSTSMPLALIYIGGLLVVTNIKAILKQWEIYAGIAAKMLILPVLCYFALHALGLAIDMAVVISFMVALPGIEMIPMLAESSGSDGEYAVGMVMIETIICLGTIPLVSLMIL